MGEVVVTGGNGLLGRAVCRELGPRAIWSDRTTLDVTNRRQVRRVLADHRPHAVVNCAAFTKVDQAESDPELCWAVNANAVADLASECDRIGATLVQISTDYVFGSDASRTTPYRENDIPEPQGVYAQSKLEGERCTALCRRHFVVRTCGLYGFSPRRNNFVETLLRLASERRRLRVVNDQRCTPSYAAHVARAVLFLLQTGEFGAYHVVNQGETTWWEFACEIFRQMRIEVEVEPITTEQYGAAAPRPWYSVLDASKYRSLGGPVLPRWEVALAEYLAARKSAP
jgi:dTDP-4-dehydrorhamnose reductase